MLDIKRHVVLSICSFISTLYCLLVSRYQWFHHHHAASAVFLSLSMLVSHWASQSNINGMQPLIPVSYNSVTSKLNLCEDESKVAYHVSSWLYCERLIDTTISLILKQTAVCPINASSIIMLQWKHVFLLVYSDVFFSFTVQDYVCLSPHLTFLLMPSNHPAHIMAFISTCQNINVGAQQQLKVKTCVLFWHPSAGRVSLCSPLISV